MWSTTCCRRSVPQRCHGKKSDPGLHSTLGLQRNHHGVRTGDSLPLSCMCVGVPTCRHLLLFRSSLCVSHSLLQTGTGKTFTIFGTNKFWDKAQGRSSVPPSLAAKPTFGGQAKFVAEDEWTIGDLQELASFRPTETCGIVSRSLYRIFDATTKHSGKYEFRVMVSFLQLYMER